MNEMSHNGNAMDGETTLKEALISLRDEGLSEMSWSDMSGRIDTSTGIGMLAALAKLNLISADPDGWKEDTTKREWRPAFLNTLSRKQLKPDQYIVSDNNRALFDLLNYKVAKEKTGRGELLVIKGRPGVGKSHLLVALCEASTKSACIVNVGDLEVEIESAMRRRERAELYHWILSFDVVLIDDMQSARDNKFLQKELRRLIVYHVDKGGKVILTGDIYMIDRNECEPTLLSLIETGTALTLELPDEPARRKILDVYYQGDIPADAAEYLSANVNKSVRQLLGAATQLINLSHQTDTTINKDMARAVLPLPSDLRHPTSLPPNAVSMITAGEDETKNVPDRAMFFREILSSAENEEEQALALQIALGQRLRELREQEKSGEDVVKMEMALSLLRDGKLEEAIKCIG